MKKRILTYSLLALSTGLSLWLPGDRSGLFHTSAQVDKNSLFRVGERLTYNISFGRFQNAAYAETYVVSNGKVGRKPAVEIQSRLKTLNFVTLDFFLIDIQRTSLVSPIDGTTLYVKDIDTSAGAAVESVTNFAEKGDGMFDLTSLLFRIRSSAGAGSFEILEGDKRYGVVFNTIGTEAVSSEAGEFPTNIVDVQSTFLTEHGISSLKINIASESSNIPVQFRAKTAKGEFRGLISSIQVATPESTPSPTPSPVQTPKPTPKPSETPSYIDNQPLYGLPFELGESLDYTVSTGGRPIGVITVSAKERKMVNGHDSLLLSAVVSGASSNELFRVGNGIRSNVNPDSLSPYDISIRFDGPLSGFNQSVRFDQSQSKALFGTTSVDIPVGTHNILSLIYAMRQFNLTPSRDASSPVNDTRVAVFWQGKPSVFTLRPARPQTITLGSQRVPAQRIVINTGIPQFDSPGNSLWLSDDSRRVPLRLILGSYQLDLATKEPEIQP